MKKLIKTLTMAISLTAYSTSSQSDPAVIAAAALGTATICCVNIDHLPPPVQIIAWPAYIGTVLTVGLAYLGGIALPIEALRFVSAPIRPLIAEKGDTTPLATSLENKLHTLVLFENNFVAIDAAGRIITWPQETKGESTDNVSVVTEVGGFVELASSRDHVLARRADGSVWSWGKNNARQLGYDIDEIILPKQPRLDPDKYYQKTPQPVPGLNHIISIAAGSEASYALDADGQIYAFGRGRTASLSPTVIGHQSGANRIYASYDSFAISTSENTIASWSMNHSLSVPELKLTGELPTAIATVEVGSDGSRLTILLADGSVWTHSVKQRWENIHGELGQGDYEEYGRLQRVKNIGHIISLTCTANCLALNDKGQIWQWGDRLSYRNWWTEHSQRLYNPYPAVVLKKKGIKSLLQTYLKLYGIKEDGSLTLLADGK